MLKLSNNINRNWFAKTEVLLVASSIGSSVAAIIFQQVAFAAITSIPLSLAISLNSSNRKRLETIEQQHQASIIQLEQKFSDKQKSVSEVIYSLPTQAELADLETRLEAYKSTYAIQLYTLNEKQSNTHLKLQEFNNSHTIADVQQRLCVLENLLQLHNPAHLHTLQENIVSIEAKIRKLEQQFNNLPIFNLQHQLLHIQELVNNLQRNSREFTQSHKCLLGEIQSISQQVQSVNSKTQELSLAHTEIQSQLKSLEAPNLDKIEHEIKFLYAFVETEFQAFVERVEGKIVDDTQLKQHLAEQVQSLCQQIQSVSSSVSERIKKLQVELQSHHIFVEKSESKIYANIYEVTDWYRKLENELQKLVEKNGAITSNQVEQSEAKVSNNNQFMCDWCHDYCKNDPIVGGYSSNYKFCRRSCKNNFENHMISGY